MQTGISPGLPWFGARLILSFRVTGFARHPQSAILWPPKNRYKDKVQRRRQTTMPAKTAVRILSVAIAIACMILPAAAQSPDTAVGKATANRLQLLEDREEIRQLLVDYGRTLDQRDFQAFAGLFSKDGEYVMGGGMGAVKGPAAISKSMEDIFRRNPTNLREPNFHLFANETIQIRGDEATALSKGCFVVPDESNKPVIVMLATYTDDLIRENGRWKIKKRVVHGDIPGPPASK
jgi:uncharacterized protein (TIGR02246 family)